MNLEDARSLCGLIAAVLVLIVLITRWRLAPFIALLLASILLAIVTGLPLGEASAAFAEGVGGLLAATALVIGFGAIIGTLLAESGGATVIAERLSGLLGPRQLGWTLFLVGTLVGIGVWFTVGLVLLAPITLMLARDSRIPAAVPICAVLAGLSAMHGLTPPHPGPLAAIGLLEANVGATILWSLLVGTVAGAVAGPLFWYLATRRAAWRDVIPAAGIGAATPGEATDDRDRHAPAAAGRGPLPSAAIGMLLLPVLLIVVGSAVETLGGSALQSEAALGRVARGLIFLGDPMIAMLIGVLACYVLLAWRHGFAAARLARLTEESLAPVANVLLIVGAGAGFSKVLIAAGVGQTLAELTSQLSLPPLLLGWLLAAAVRVATGSATTAITTAAGLVAALVQQDASIDRELMVLAMGAGSLTLSHVNDGGFWFVKEYFGLTVEQTLKTWTVLETVLSVVALAWIVLLDFIM
jgi:GntP family gluconate:H+ symporter